MRSLSLKETANGTEKREFRLKQRNHGSDTVPHEGVCQGESKTFFVQMERRPLLSMRDRSTRSISNESRSSEPGAPYTVSAYGGFDFAF